jgi:hypothetical protein
MPGNWPLDDGPEDLPISIAGARLQRMEALQHRNMDHHQMFLPLQADMTVEPLRIQPRNQSRNQSPAPYPTSPVTPDELFMPGPTSPAREFALRPRNAARRLPQPPPAIPPPNITTPTIQSERPPIPRMQLRVDTLTMQAEPQNIPSPRQLGEQYFNSPVSEAPVTSFSSHISNQNLSSPSVPDELFFDSPAPSNMSNNGERRIPTYLPIHPVVYEEPNIEDTDWKRYDPPAELRRPEHDTSVIIASILVPSIDRLMARFEGEDERQRAAARSGGQLVRSRRASINSRRVSTRPSMILFHILMIPRVP